MMKLVNIQANIPVRTITPPVYGNIKNIQMSTGNIFKCLCGKAFVDEILKDGSTLRLDFSNYNKVNEPVKAVLSESQEGEHEMTLGDQLPDSGAELTTLALETEPDAGTEVADPDMEETEEDVDPEPIVAEGEDVSETAEEAADTETTTEEVSEPVAEATAETAATSTEKPKNKNRK